MSFNNFLDIRPRTNSLSNPALARPLITFNYQESKITTSSINLQQSNKRAKNIEEPLLSNIGHPNQYTPSKTKRNRARNLVLSCRSIKRKMIAESNSNKGLIKVQFCPPSQNYRGFCETRQPMHINQAQNKSIRKRNSIFQSYNPKVNLQTKDCFYKNERSDMNINMPFNQPVHPRKLTSYMQLTPTRVPNKREQESPVAQIILEKHVKQKPLRDTYIAERDTQIKILVQKQIESKDIVQKEYYEIPIPKKDRSLLQKAQFGDLFSKSKNRNFNNLQFEEESITGYSQRQAHHPDGNIEDLPQLFLQTNDRFTEKIQKSLPNKPKRQPSTIIDSKLLQTTVVPDKSQDFSKQSSYHQNYQSCKVIRNSNSKSVFATMASMPQFLIVLGLLLFFIQILK